YALGGDIDEISGPKHSEGGVQITDSAEVEGGEVKAGDYVFSDQLTLPGTNKTFAEEAKKIKKRYEERPGDGPSERSKASELQKLMEINEVIKAEQEKKDAEAAEMLEQDHLAYGGHVR